MSNRNSPNCNPLSDDSSLPNFPFRTCPSNYYYYSPGIGLIAFLDAIQFKRPRINFIPVARTSLEVKPRSCIARSDRKKEGSRTGRLKRINDACRTRQRRARPPRICVYVYIYIYWKIEKKKKNPIAWTQKQWANKGFCTRIDIPLLFFRFANRENRRFYRHLVILELFLELDDEGSSIFRLK